MDETTPPEVNDLSGPYYPYLTHAHLSKAFLLRTMHAWLVMNEGYYFALMRRFGRELADEDECELKAWIRVAERTNKRYAPVGEFKLETVTDSLKVVLQLAMDSTMGYFPVKYGIKSPNHVVLAISKGRWPNYLDNPGAQRTPPMYHHGGTSVMGKYVVNSRIKVTPL